MYENTYNLIPKDTQFKLLVEYAQLAFQMPEQEARAFVLRAFPDLRKMEIASS